MPNRSFKLILPNGVSLQPAPSKEVTTDLIEIYLDPALDLSLKQQRPLISLKAFDYTVNPTESPLAKDSSYGQELIMAFISTLDRYTPLEVPPAWKLLMFVNTWGEKTQPTVDNLLKHRENHILGQKLLNSLTGPDSSITFPVQEPDSKTQQQLWTWALKKSYMYCCNAQECTDALHTVASTIKELTVGVPAACPPIKNEPPVNSCQVLHYLLLCVFTNLNIKYTKEAENVTLTALKILFPEAQVKSETPVPTNASPKHPLESTESTLKKETGLFTGSQTQCFIKLKALANLYFNDPKLSYVAIKPRLNPLIAGPTGSGKSHLVRKLAEDLNLPYIRLTYGQWLPTGTRQGDPTPVTLARFLVKHPKCLLHLDELDKWATESEWSRCISTDLWDVLEGILPIPYKDVLDDEDNVLDLDVARKTLKSSTFIVGSGTWQEAFNKNAIPLGFGQTGSTDADKLNSIHTAKMIPQELLGRFHTDICILNYPNKAETKTLLDNLGLTKLAASVNSPLTDISWEKTGFRALESLTSDLLVKHQTLNQVVQNTV